MYQSININSVVIHGVTKIQVITGQSVSAFN